jgi:hypothetical protein
MRNGETRMANRLYLDDFAFDEPSHLLRWCGSLAVRSWRSLPRPRFLQLLHLFRATISDGGNRVSAKSCLSAIVFVLNGRFDRAMRPA